MEELHILKKRLDRIGIDIKFAANYPWIYVDKINGKKVTERFKAEHGFTVAFLPVRRDMPFHFTDLKEIFKLIRKYSGCAMSSGGFRTTHYQNTTNDNRKHKC